MAAVDPALNLTIKPNSSIGTREFACLLVPALSLPFAAGAVFAVAGAWMVLPFALVEAAVVAMAVFCNWRSSQAYERFVIEDRRLSIEIGSLRVVEKFEINTAWVQLVESRQGSDYRLAMRAHGREIEIGRHMNIEGRRGLAALLRQKLNSSA